MLLTTRTSRQGLSHVSRNHAGHGFLLLGIFFSLFPLQSSNQTITGGLVMERHKGNVVVSLITWNRQLTLQDTERDTIKPNWKPAIDRGSLGSRIIFWTRLGRDTQFSRCCEVNSFGEVCDWESKLQGGH